MGSSSYKRIRHLGNVIMFSRRAEQKKGTEYWICGTDVTFLEFHNPSSQIIFLGLYGDAVADSSITTINHQRGSQAPISSHQLFVKFISQQNLCQQTVECVKNSRTLGLQIPVCIVQYVTSCVGTVTITTALTNFLVLNLLVHHLCFMSCCVNPLFPLLPHYPPTLVFAH